MLPNPWVLLGAAGVWLLSMLGVGYWQRHDGAAQCQAAWGTKQSTELAAANSKIVELSNKARQQEHDWQTLFDQRGEKLRKENADAKAVYDADLARVRAGSLVFHDPGPAAGRPDTGPAGPAAPGPAGSAADVSGGLSGPATEFLLAEAARADERTRELNKCIGLLAIERGQDPTKVSFR